ncbi:MAG: CocE/NonD family hydrolase [Sphingomonas sp.]|nr:CocE/NonD family hydrolase [Sphingomonas sp.]
MRRSFILFASAALLSSAGTAQQATTPAWAPDIPPSFTVPSNPNYDVREAMIPMRDGVKLYTVIVSPKGVTNAPIILTRTPYNASARAKRSDSDQMVNRLPEADELYVGDGYIRVYQDIRGKYKSEGEYIVTRPPIGPLNPTKVDHTTDAYDTIAWLVDRKNLPQSNGKVGMVGSSYEGFTVVAALLGPHPALKVAAPQSPMIDGWMGDDWFHHGAFRLANIAWIGAQTGYKGEGKAPSTGGWDDYDNFRRVGSAGEWAKLRGYDQLPFWRKMSEHPAYDEFWQGQAMDKLLAANPSNVPTFWEQGMWDQEDMYGAIHAWEALKGAGRLGNNYLVMGPWRHSQINRNGETLGPFHWEGDTALQYRRNMLLPFFNAYLKDGAPAFTPPSVTLYDAGLNRWDRYQQWPTGTNQPIYLQGSWGLGFGASSAGEDSYVSDPAKPVPHLPRPVNFGDGRWGDYLVTDQRFVDGRTDVLTYQTEPLKQAVKVSGVPWADIYAKTSGTDMDVVVKVIDVFPDEIATKKEMGGYQLPISMDIFRGRYRESFSNPTPIPAGKVQRYKFRLPAVNHTFQPGHRIMVQIQSSLFPVYDRNPQKYVQNIFFAKPSDYRQATVTIERGGSTPSSVILPVVR